MSCPVYQLKSKAVSREEPLSLACHRSPRIDSDLSTCFVPLTPSGVNEAPDYCYLGLMIP
jgi:hypothetical protein